jgi:hypothetical protein
LQIPLQSHQLALPLALLAVPRDELPAIAPAHCRRRSSLRLKNTILATAATATKQNTSMLRY